MGLRTCVDCGRKVSDAASACPGCGRPGGGPAAAAATATPKGGLTSGEILGALLFLAGVAGALYYFQFFKTSVSTSLGEFNNIGLLAERQQGMMIAGFVAAVGLVLMVALRKKR